MGTVDLLVYSPWLVKLAAVVVGVVLLVLRRERYRPPRQPTEWTLPTTEVFIDPETGRRQRVYVSPASGARSYVDEDPSAIVYPPLERPGLVGPPPRPGLPGPPPALPPGG
jgi:hypothetical protein